MSDDDIDPRALEAAIEAWRQIARVTQAYGDVRAREMRERAAALQCRYCRDGVKRDGKDHVFALPGGAANYVPCDGVLVRRALPIPGEEPPRG